jgi:hypothetical protein
MVSADEHGIARSGGGIPMPLAGRAEVEAADGCILALVRGDNERRLPETIGIFEVAATTSTLGCIVCGGVVGGNEGVHLRHVGLN